MDQRDHSSRCKLFRCLPSRCSLITSQNELRAICVALGNDLAYVVQAVAPNFVWQTTAFPRARKGYHWSISTSLASNLNIITPHSSSQFYNVYSVRRCSHCRAAPCELKPPTVLWTALIVFLLRRDRRISPPPSVNTDEDYKESSNDGDTNSVKKALSEPELRSV